MIIYLLPPEELDDKTLDKQIEAVAQTLCNVHHIHIGKSVPFGTYGIEFLHAKVPDDGLYFLDFEGEEEIIKWCLKCRANYLKLVEMGLACCEEYTFRRNDKGRAIFAGDFPDGEIVSKQHRLQPVIEFARDNVPDLPVSVVTLTEFCKTRGATSFPLVMPKEYILSGCDIYKPTAEVYIITSYRNYYRAKLPKDVVFTRRQKPEWL